MQFFWDGGTIFKNIRSFIVLRSIGVKDTSEIDGNPKNPGTKEEPAGPSRRLPGPQGIGKKILLVIAVVLLWLVIKRVVITHGSEVVMIIIFSAAAALVLWVTQRLNW